MRKNKYSKVVLLFLIIALLASCNLNGSKKEKKESAKQTILFTISSSDIPADSFVLTSTGVNFSINTNLPSDISGTDIKWYVNYADGPTQVGTGKTLKLTPNNENKDANLRYKVSAKIETNKYTGTSNTVSFYAITDNNATYKRYMTTIYEYIDEHNYKPGLSVSVHGKDFSFDFYDGLAQMNNNVRNTASTQHFLGSISKSFVAAAIINLLGDDNIKSRKLSYYTDKIDLSYVQDNAIDNMDATIEEVLKHTAGIGDFIGVNLIADLFCYKKNALERGIVGLATGVSNPSYKFSDWKAAKICQYIIPNDATYGVRKYSTPAYVILGMIAEYEAQQKASDNTFKLSEYYDTNFFTAALGTDGLKLPPQDEVDYSKLAHPHEFKSGLSTLVEENTQITAAQLDGILTLLSSESLFDMTNVVPDVNKLFAEISWSGGAIVGTSKEVASWGYNILCKDPNNSAIPEINKVFVASAPSVVWEYGYGIRLSRFNNKAKTASIDLIGHHGKTAGSENLMYYCADTDYCYVIFQDSTTADYSKEGLDGEALLYDLCTADIAALSN